MNRQPVSSRAVEAIGYDEQERLLEVHYKQGRIYRYLAVPPEEHQALMSADSIGGYVNRRIKPRYRFTRLGSRT